MEIIKITITFVGKFELKFSFHASFWDLCIVRPFIVDLVYGQVESSHGNFMIKNNYLILIM